MIIEKTETKSLIYPMTERQRDSKIHKQTPIDISWKDRERERDKMTDRQKYGKTERQKGKHHTSV